MYSIFDKPILQAAGVRSKEDANTLVDSGFLYIGFPLRLSYHPVDISENTAKNIIAELPSEIYPVLITYETNLNELINLIHFLNVNIVQIHSEIDFEVLENLKFRIPDLKIIKSLIVKEDNLEDLKNIVKVFSTLADAFITDTYDNLTGACGATGKTHNWDISRKLVEVSPRPIILAGGLNPQNVAEAIETVKPAGVDVHTGIENTAGLNDPGLCSKFIIESIKSFGEI